MFCRPASSSRATNGVVFHTSASTTGTHASVVLRNQSGGVRTMPDAASSAFAMPACPSKMKRQSSAETTVGMAQGTRIDARTSARPRNARFMASARTQPRPSSMVTLATVNTTVCSRALPEPGVAERFGVVGEAHERAAEPGHAEIVEVDATPRRSRPAGTGPRAGSWPVPAAASCQARRASRCSAPLRGSGAALIGTAAPGPPQRCAPPRAPRGRAAPASPSQRG